jgi:hypothetical protein
MTNSDLLVRTGELAAEDQLWPGLRFEVLTTSELPAQHSAGGDQVHYHRGVWWRQVNPFFCLPCSTFQLIDPSESWPEWHRSLAGYMHLSATGTASNATFRAIVNDDVKNYSINTLNSKRNIRDVRRAVSNVEVSPIDRDILLHQGRRVHDSWRQRVGWGQDRSGERFVDWVECVCDRPKRMNLGAFVGGELVAFMLPFATGNVVRIAFTASHTDFLKFRPNDALYHALLCIARQTPGITVAHFGAVSGKPTLNDFKLRFGWIREFPAYTKLNPLLKILAGERMYQRYPWLGVRTKPVASLAVS